MVTVQQIGEMLTRVDFPATREELIAALVRLQAPEEVIERLGHIPEYRYGSVNTVLDALHGLR